MHRENDGSWAEDQRHEFKRPQLLRRSNAVDYDGNTRSAKHWTIVLLAPSGFHKNLPHITEADGKLKSPGSEFAVPAYEKEAEFVAFVLIGMVLNGVVTRWRQLAEPLDRVIDPPNLFLDYDH
jgi:hypothetical protein